MIEHIVLFKVKSEASATDADRMLEELRGLAKSVPTILELTCGTNISSRNQGFTHGLFVRFGSRADLEAYMRHPEHQRVLEDHIRPITENIIVVEYEV